MQAPEEIKRLVQQFEEQKHIYTNQSYLETPLRSDFIDPFFIALGWDIYNTSANLETHREVYQEYRLNNKMKPDYSFCIGGNSKFFVEAKRPSENLFINNSHSLQVRKYGWNAKLPLCILTNFKELAIYDTRIQPKENDNPNIACIKRYSIDKYIENWQEIYDVFSKEAVENGSIEKYNKEKQQKNITTVDKQFLKDIEEWRINLAKNLISKNELNKKELNFATQAIIDRIIFLRICEDRGIEEKDTLIKITKSEEVYKELIELFKNADDKYNSGLFHFKSEKGRGYIDILTPKLDVSNSTLKNIISNLYHPKSPYVFSVIPADILGQVYEQFLGKVIELKSACRIQVEEKPEVRRAGGVYYTPKYIVDYIVKNTIGELLKRKTPKKVEKITICDPACGSGSFLIVAYQYLLDWHLNYYISKGDKKHIYEIGKGEYRLTTKERKKILLNNIYGVDIDTQAVEVTKLSLLLKVLEGETEESINRQLSIFKERALPDLSNNIKCGNSLIGNDFYNQPNLNLTEEEIEKVNTFDWETEFKEVFDNGKFDCIIGNPPYVNIDDTWGKKDPKLSYIKHSYSEVYNDKTDILFYFIKKAIDISKNKVGFIISRAFLEAYKANKLRYYISQNTSIDEIFDFQNYYIFPNVGITTCLIFLNKKPKSSPANIYKVKNVLHQIENSIANKKDIDCYKINQSQFTENSWLFANNEVQEILNKIDKNGQELSKILVIGQGMQTGKNSVFGKFSIDDIKNMGLKKGQFFQRARNSDIKRYFLNDSKEYLVYLEDFESFDALPDKLKEYLNQHETELQNRAAYKRGNCEWWKYTWSLHKDCYNRDKILCPYISKENRFAIDKDKHYLSLTDTTVIFDNNQEENLEYIVGLLNSKLLTFRYKYIGKLKSGNMLEYFWNQISKIPLRRINFSSPTDKTNHNRIVELVDKMIGLNKVLQSIRTPHEKNNITRQIQATDNQIDSLVYELYGLTEEEIKTVEENS